MAKPGSVSRRIQKIVNEVFLKSHASQMDARASAEDNANLCFGTLHDDVSRALKLLVAAGDKDAIRLKGAQLNKIAMAVARRGRRKCARAAIRERSKI